MSDYLGPCETLKPIDPTEPVCHMVGAGFSRACCDQYPVSNGFLVPTPYFELDITYGNSVRINDYTAGLLDRLKKHYGPLDLVNVEDVMTDLYTRGFGVGSAWELQSGDDCSVESAQRDYRGLLHYIADKLFLLDKASNHSPLARRFLSALRTQDSVISLNYDVLVERHLAREINEEPDRRIRDLAQLIGPPNLRYGDSRPGTLAFRQRGELGVFVKLHGSIDWYACANVECPFHGYMTPGFRTRNDTNVTCWGRCTVCGSGTETGIVPPTHAKPFDRFPKIRLMWLLAYHALIYAPRWTFVGTSFAPADFHLASLIRSSSRDSTCFGPNSNGGEICIVDKDLKSARQLESRLRRYLSPDIQQRVHEGAVTITPFGSLGDYLDASDRFDSNRKNAHAEEV